MEPSIHAWISGRKGNRSAASGIGYYDAFRLYIRHSIFYPSSSDSVPQDAWRTLVEIFSYRTWKKDAEKLGNEEVSVRGEKAGGQFMYAIRRIRELPDKDTRFAGMKTFKCLPVEGIPALHGNLINEFDSFILYKMKPLRKAMRFALSTASSLAPSHAPCHAPSPSTSTNVIPVAQIPSEQSAFVSAIRPSRGRKRDVVEALILLRTPVHSCESEAM